MLGKRFRRTTSMSHLGPASGLGVGNPIAETTPEKVHGATTPHSVPHKAARPWILQAHSSEYDAMEGRADVRNGDVKMVGCALASQQQRPCLVINEGACAVDAVYNDLDMEAMGLGCGDNQVNSMVCCGMAGAKVAGSEYSDTMMKGGEMVQANGGISKAKCGEEGPGSPMAYQMGLWMQSGMSYGVGRLAGQDGAISPVDFLDVCYHCKRRLRHERDIYIYRGDTAFCSEECRHSQILIDERRSSRGSNSKRAGGRRARSTSETAVAA